jgi:hypothetical protein
MLRITVDFVPGAYNPCRRTIASMTIANVSDLADRSNCRVEAIEGRNDLAGLSPRNISARAEDHDRRQSVWSLIAKAAAAPASPRVVRCKYCLAARPSRRPRTENIGCPGD